MTTMWQDRFKCAYPWTCVVCSYTRPSDKLSPIAPSDNHDANADGGQRPPPDKDHDQQDLTERVDMMVGREMGRWVANNWMGDGGGAGSHPLVHLHPATLSGILRSSPARFDTPFTNAWRSLNRWRCMPALQFNLIDLI